MTGEIQQCLHLWGAVVEFLESRLQLSGDITDELRLQGIAFIGKFDGFLLFACLEDIAQQDNGTDSKGCSECYNKDNQSDNDYPTGCQRAVFISDGSLIVSNLLLQGIQAM